jgi:predicted DNA binding CopG/RHH family protein
MITNEKLMQDSKKKKVASIYLSELDIKILNELKSTSGVPYSTILTQALHHYYLNPDARNGWLIPKVINKYLKSK